MNIGLNNKRNMPIFTNSFGTNDIAYLNLDKENANLIMHIPTITRNEGVENQIGDILVLYNYLSKDITSSFGKGITISMLKFISGIEKDDENKIERIEIQNADFTKTIFTREENTNIFKNNDTDSFILYDDGSLETNNEQVTDTEYTLNFKLYDNIGNYYQFNYDGESEDCNPTLFHKVEFSDDENIYFSIDSDSYIKLFYKSQKVEVNLLSTNEIKNIKFFINDIEYSRCEFQYLEGYLTDIYKYVYHVDDNDEVVNGLVEHKEYVLSDPGYIKVKDALTGHFTKYYITDNKVSSFVNCFEDNEESGKETLIRYNDSYTNVINYKGQLNKYYFVNGRIEHIQYYNGRISTIKYDEAGRIIERINNLDVSDEGKERNGNLFSAGNTFEEGSYTVENLTGDSYVNVTTLANGTKGLSIYNDSELEEIEIRFIIDDIYLRRDQGVTFIVEMLKLNSSNCEPLEFIIYLYNKNRPNYFLASESMYLKANELFGYCINTSKMRIVNDTFNTAEVVIKVPANYGESVISNMQLYCDLLGTINEYNEYGCLSKSWDRKNVISRSFIKEDKRLLLISNNPDTNSSIVNYDEHGNVTEIINGDGTRVEKTYDSNGNCTSQKVINKNNKYIESAFTYTSDGLQVASETNNDGVTTRYAYDQYNRVLKEAEYPNGLIEQFKYNDKLFVKYHENTDERYGPVYKDFTYNSNDRLETVKINNNYSYKFEYDTYGNVISNKLVKNTTLTELEKDTYELNGDVYTENLETRRVGNNDSVNNKRKYTYDLEDRLERVYLAKEDVETLLYEFKYNNSGNLTKIIDHKYEEEFIFTYDKYNNLVQEETVKGSLSVKTNYRYDLKGKLLSMNYSVGTSNLGHYILNNGDRKYKSPVKINNYYNGKDDIYSCFLLSREKSGEVKADLMGRSGIIKHVDKTKIPTVIEYDNGIIKSFNLVNNVSKYLSYECPLNIKNGEGNTFAFWFKTSSYDNNNAKTLFSICDLHRDDCEYEYKYLKYDVILSSDGKIGVCGVSGLTSNELVLNEWNFIALKILQEENGSVITVNLNGVETVFTSENILVYESQEICFGNEVTNKEIGYGVTGEITCLFMSDTLLNDITINEIYKQTKESYIDYVSLDNDRFNKHFVTNRIDNNAQYNIVPLKNSFEVLNNSLEYQFEENDLFISELDNLFKYDDNFNDYVYNAEGHKLVYKVPYSGAMHMGAKALIKELTGNQMILEFANQSQGLVGLFVDSIGLLKGYINNTVIDTGVTITPNTVNKYFLAYSIDNYDELTRQFIYKVRIMVNGEVLIDNYYYVSSELLVEKIVVGASLNTTTYSDFNGSMNMLCINTTTSLLDNVLDLDSGEKVIDKVNNIGQLFEHQVLKDNQNIIKHEITYKQVDTHPDKCYNTITKDEFFTSDLDNSVRKIDYQNDLNTGNVTRRTLCNQTQTLDDVEYEYDKFGQLREERNHTDDRRISYSYDRIGNLSGKFEYQLSTNTLINRTYFECDTTNPTKLVNFTKNDSSKTINYHDNMLGMPKNIVDDDGNVLCSFDWDYRNLSRYTVSEDYYINYTYNSSRLRTSKEIVNNMAGGTIVHNYRYSGNLLIEEVVDDNIKGETYKLNYLYDQFGKLYGFKYDNILYYYLRDSLGTIIGIVDSSKQLVCEYKYDAYGNHTVLNSNRVEASSRYFVGNINPFRYKGYYYDVETQLFYCNSRYYSPELCRFISPDDVSYLDPESVNGLNLYCYCKNDPVNYVDPDGHIALWALALIGIAVCGLINGTVNTMTKMPEESAWGAFAGGFFEGAVSAAALAAGLAIGTFTGGAGWAILGGAVAVTGGFIGGKYGNAISQQISYGNVDWEVANLNGGLAALTNLVSYAGLYVNKDILSTSDKLGIRFLENVGPSTVGLGMTAYIASLPKLNLNELRDEERIKSQRGRFIWDYLF